LAAIEAAYARGETDEFVKPTAVGSYRGMKDGDGVLMANFRADRARQILTALLDPAFNAFQRPRTVRFAAALGMSEYSTALNAFMTTLFPAERLNHVLGAVIAEAGLKQLRIAETEKYAHVTFFLNGGEEALFPGEERILVPSPKVATYDLKPEMSAIEVTDKLVEAIRGDKFDLIVVNYANTDMVGHTGDLDAAIKAVETVDTCLGRLRDALAERGGAMVITADHGNAETMQDPVTREPHTAHTLNRVPIVLVNGIEGTKKLRDGRLADIAPTVLSLMGLRQPAEMTGRSLIPAATGAHGRESGQRASA
jgi:2,3-bisphosphoglycerate-independent phosphoglycerate mutase